MLKLTPVFSTKPRYTLKLLDVVCHYDQSATSRMACNHLIIRANRSSFPGKLGTNLPAMYCCQRVIVQNLKSGYKSLDYGQIPFWSLTFLRTVDQFHQGDRADTHPGCVEVKAFSDMFRFVFNSKNADVGIKHEFQHQKPSRSCSAGCSLPLIKSVLTHSPSNQLSQDSPAGVISLLLPTAMTSTSFTPSGKETAFGSLTAWVRLLRNSVVFIISSLKGIYTSYIHYGLSGCICQRYIPLRGLVIKAGEKA